MKKLLKLIAALPAYVFILVIFTGKYIVDCGEWLSEKANELGGKFFE